VEGCAQNLVVCGTSVGSVLLLSADNLSYCACCSADTLASATSAVTNVTGVGVGTPGNAEEVSSGSTALGSVLSAEGSLPPTPLSSPRSSSHTSSQFKGTNNSSNSTSTSTTSAAHTSLSPSTARLYSEPVESTPPSTNMSPSEDILLETVYLTPHNENGNKASEGTDHSEHEENEKAESIASPTQQQQHSPSTLHSPSQKKPSDLQVNNPQESHKHKQSQEHQQSQESQLHQDPPIHETYFPIPQTLTKVSTINPAVTALCMSADCSRLITASETGLLQEWTPKK